MEVFHSDNIGNRMPPHPNMSAPTLASGLRLRPSKNINTEQTVVAGATYAITVRKSFFVFGLADTDTDANVIWACAPSQTIVIKIPTGYTTLHYMGCDDNPELRIRRLTMPGD